MAGTQISLCRAADELGLCFVYVYFHIISSCLLVLISGCLLVVLLVAFALRSFFGFLALQFGCQAFVGVVLCLLWADVETH